MSSAEPVDLTNCDREPIHIPGSIQTTGCLIACDVLAERVLRHSTNTADLIGYAGGPLNGQLLDQVLGIEAAHEIRNALSASAEPDRPSLLFGLALAGSAARFDVAVHRFRGAAVIEFEPASGDPSDLPLSLTRSLVGQLAKNASVDSLLRKATRIIQAMLRYDRVMIYQFMPDGSGQVVAESKRHDLESFRGQYFPATDIPQQARLLYVKNIIRIVSNASGAAVPIDPVLDVSGEPLDLSYAHLRSVSPIHCEYLRNMGVAASMSVSIIVDGALWGLIACHHYSPHALTMAERVAMEMFGEFFSLHLEALSRKKKLEMATYARQALDEFVQQAASSRHIAPLLASNLKAFAGLMPCDGVGLWLDGQWTSQGYTPPEVAVPGLARFVGSMVEGRIWATHALSQQLPSAEGYFKDVSGVLAVPLSQRPKDYLFFFRREVLQTVEWAGDPEKTYQSGQFGDRLTPRKSFAIWKQVVERQSNPWIEEYRDIADAARITLLEIVVKHAELVAEERDKSAMRQRLLNDELNHRVKNILALINSLVAHPVEAGRSLGEYADGLKGRIQALAYAHDQVVRSDGGGSLADLLNAELSPYRASSTTIALEGPSILLDGRAFSVMALVLHELATNAAKYGALSKPGGSLDIRWSLSEEGGCDIAWKESGGPRVSPPSRTGFGTVLVDRSIPHDLGGTSRIDYHPSGVAARLFIPAAYVEAGADEAMPTPEAAGARTAKLSALDDLKILVLEDQLLIAMNVETMLAERGAAMVETSATVADARRKLLMFTPDAAVLDVNLGAAETSLDFAVDLAAQAIPFIFATGYGDTGIIPPELSAIPIVRKPYDPGRLADAILRAIGRA